MATRAEKEKRYYELLKEGKSSLEALSQTDAEFGEGYSERSPEKYVKKYQKSEELPYSKRQELEKTNAYNQQVEANKKNQNLENDERRKKT